MEQALDILTKILVATYTICLPLALAWVRNIRKEKKDNTQYMQKSVEELKQSVEDLSEKIDLNEALTCRYRIIRAADEIARGVFLSKDALMELGEARDIYQAYCDNHPTYKNHKGKTSMAIISEYEKKYINAITNDKEVLDGTSK